MDEPDIATMAADQYPASCVGNLVRMTDKGEVKWQPHSVIGWVGERRLLTTSRKVLERITPNGNHWRTEGECGVRFVPHSACPDDFADLHEAILRSILNDTND
jgi:hypothetical protein